MIRIDTLRPWVQVVIMNLILLIHIGLGNGLFSKSPLIPLIYYGIMIAESVLVSRSNPHVNNELFAQNAAVHWAKWRKGLLGAIVTLCLPVFSKIPLPYISVIILSVDTIIGIVLLHWTCVSTSLYVDYKINQLRRNRA